MGYMAPELLGPDDEESNPKATCETDMYAFGSLCFEVFDASRIAIVVLKVILDLFRPAALRKSLDVENHDKSHGWGAPSTTKRKCEHPTGSVVLHSYVLELRSIDTTKR